LSPFAAVTGNISDGTLGRNGWQYFHLRPSVHGRGRQIEAGDDYVTVLNMQVAQCDVLLVGIVPRWFDASDEKVCTALSRKTTLSASRLPPRSVLASA
jgi:hypothetical protein